MLREKVVLDVLSSPSPSRKILSCKLFIQYIHTEHMYCGTGILLGALSALSHQILISNALFFKFFIYYYF